jgi:hypothetical protein
MADPQHSDLPRQSRDVVIKVVAKGEEGLRELQILQVLSSEPLSSDPSNPTVRVLEFLTYGDWHFAVMPFCDSFDDCPFLTASEFLDFAEQALRVSSAWNSKTLQFKLILGIVFFALQSDSTLGESHVAFS